MSASATLLKGIDALGVPVVRLVTDSRAVRRGDTFVAYPGERADGRQFIPQAVAQGANAVIWDTDHYCWDGGLDVPNLGLADLRRKAGELADAVYGAPSEHLWMVGITGTNGKTSTCHWVAEGLSRAGKKCAMIGTLGNGFAGKLEASPNTTPDAIRVHGLLAEYLECGAAAVAMEVSSHALSQGRVTGVRFDVALLTNLSRDHLDYHGDMASYAAAKRRLFDWRELKHAVINIDDAFGADLAVQLRDQEVEVIAYGMTEGALHLAERNGMRMVYGELSAMDGQGMQLAIRSSWGSAALSSGLIGRFNASNLLGVLGVLLVSGIDMSDALETLGQVHPVAGRMQKIGGAGKPAVVVDYAHTPDALEKVLVALREVNAASGGALWCVFGCGGDRDSGKRAMMGRVAARFADRCIVTSDNPRSEDPLRIIGDIVSGMAENGHEIIADRATAINHAIRQAELGDTVLIAGKGHEDYQEAAGVKQPFSDLAVAMQALDQWTEWSGRVQ